jgi:kynurenine formamidase
MRENNWGRWGPDEERGTLNLLTPDLVQRAAGLIKTGKTYSLALPLDRHTLPVSPSRVPVVHMLTLDGGDFAAGVRLPHDLRAADDYISMPTQSGTHIDALAHVWQGDELYNGHSANRVRSYGATRCGIDKIGPIVGRGVLLDVAAYQGVTVLERGYQITDVDLEACARAQGVTVGPGDIVLVHTGWLAAMIGNMPEFHTSQPGIGTEAARWLVERDVAAVGADNTAVEWMTWEGRRGSPNLVHRLLIHEFGVHMMEFVKLNEIARDRVYEFFLVVAPLPIKGGVGSPINPVAIA